MECLCTRYIVRGTCGTWYMVHGTWYVVAIAIVHIRWQQAGLGYFQYFSWAFVYLISFDNTIYITDMGSTHAVGRSVRSIFIFTCLAAVV